MMKVASIVTFLIPLLTWSASFCAEPVYHGKAFSVWLPVKPQVYHSNVEGRLGKAESWKYEGTYQSADKSTTVAYSIEHAQGMSLIFLQRSEEALANYLKDYFLTIAGSLGRERWTGVLKDGITKGGYGLDVEYWMGDVIRTRIIVSKPRIWVLNVIAISGTKEAVEILNKIFATFNISNNKSLACIPWRGCSDHCRGDRLVARIQ